MFRGAYTAIVTPFHQDGTVDWAKLEEHIEAQIAGGVDGIVPVGTTGESPTLSVEEHERVIETSVKKASGRAKVIAGTGANSTAEALRLTQHAKDVGADATLQVTPYYNKPSQTGLIRHFTAVADLGLPVVLYNIPGRSGRDIAVETVVELAAHPGIVAVKEASGDVDRVSCYAAQCDIIVLSGDDGLTLPMMSVGAKGVISVASNLFPKEIADMVHAALDGRWAEARALHHTLHPLLMALLSLDTNPVPIKAALEIAGRMDAVYRLPLCEMADEGVVKLRAVLAQTGLL